MDEFKPKKSYKFMGTAAKFLQPIFNILFYICVFFIILSVILSIILVFVNVDVEEMLMPPFMHKIENTGAADNLNGGADTVKLQSATAYEISFGNGIKVKAAPEDVTLDDIKSALFAGIFVLIFTLLTIAPVFRFLSLLLKNVNKGNMLSDKNPRYVMYIGLCIFVGSILIRFVMRFYNYYLAVRFIKDAADKINLSLGIDMLSGITGLAILFIGMIFAYIFDRQK